MNDIMDTLFFTKKGRLMDAVESFFIFRETKLDNQLNDKLTVKQNIIFETAVREDPTEGFTTPAAHINRSLLSLT